MSREADEFKRRVHTYEIKIKTTLGCCMSSEVDETGLVQFKRRVWLTLIII